MRSFTRNVLPRYLVTAAVLNELLCGLVCAIGGDWHGARLFWLVAAFMGLWWMQRERAEGLHARLIDSLHPSDTHHRVTVWWRRGNPAPTVIMPPGFPGGAVEGDVALTLVGHDADLRVVMMHGQHHDHLHGEVAGA